MLNLKLFFQRIGLLKKIKEEIKPDNFIKLYFANIIKRSSLIIPSSKIIKVALGFIFSI